MKIPFVKMSGSGNDFVIIDGRGDSFIAEDRKPELVKIVSHRKTGVGCDGVLLVEDSESGDFMMRYFNADGGEVEFCGNGARCIAYFAHHRLGLSSGVIFDSRAGMISAEVRGDDVEVLMPPAGEVRGPKSLEVGPRRMEYYFVNTGVPHVVVLCEDIANAPVVQLGRMIRNHPAFQPDGTNVDFLVECDGGNADIEIRTYERGVEDETLACGTGAVACALVMQHRERFDWPIRVQVALPDVLTVSKPGRRCTLAGRVREIFTGEFEFDGGAN